MAVKVKDVVKTNRATSPVRLIAQLNFIIRGWCNYHRHVASKSTFSKLDNYMWVLLWNWAVRRHPGKSHTWIKEKYFKLVGSDNWVFSGKDEKGKQVSLFKASHTKIVRHRLIRGDANPYDPEWQEYFKKRSRSKSYMPPKLRLIFNAVY